MPEQNSETTQPSWMKPLGEFITAFVLLTHAIVFFQLVICSKNMVVSFNIPTKNIGIYLGKLSGIRSLLMSVGGAAEYGFYNIINLACSTHVKTIRQSVSVFSLTCLTITRLIFLIFLYYPETASFRNYIVLIIGAFFVGSFQISAFSLSPHVSALSWLSVYLSGILSFVIQVILDMCWSKRPSLTFKIQSWISLILSIISVGLWPCNLFLLTDDGSSKNAQGTEQPTSGTSGSSNGSGSGCKNKRSLGYSCSSTRSRSDPNTEEFGHNQSTLAHQSNDLKMEYLMTMSSLTILKTMIYELDRLCTCTDNRQQITSVKFLINVLEQIRSEDDICVRLLIRIDLLIVGLKEICCLEGETTLLEQLVFVLRGKYILAISRCKNELTERLSLQPESQIQEPGTGRKRQRRNTSEETQNTSNGGTSIYYSISPFLMFGAGSLVKDFLFPGVIPYGLLERDKCHLINLIVIIFLSIGPIAVFVLDKVIDDFKCNHIYYHGFWFCMIPEIVIFLISLSAIHSNQSCTHQIRSSRWRVFLMTMILLTCYGFLETVNIVGVPNIANGNSFKPHLIAINNICGKFVRYFVYKFSVGYNKTRISAGFTLPNFRPPEPIGDSFCYWFWGALSNGWKDIKGDFKFNIKQYLAVGPTVSKKSPIETLRYCDIFM